MANQEATARIHAQMTIEEILSLFPHKAQKLTQEMAKVGLNCVGCQGASVETLEVGMKSHGMGDELVQEFVQRLNALLDAPVDLSTITLTARAAAKFKSILEEEGKVGWGMRFSERLAGCSGFEYVLEFSEKKEDDDIEIVWHGVALHVNREMYPNLVGAEIDYADGLQGSGFKISNPNVKSSCGCGSSHGY